MTVMKAFAVWLLAVLCVGNLAAQEEGLIPSWEVEAIANELREEVGEVEHLLAGLKPEQWRQAGAAYAGQREALAKELGYLKNSALALAARPEDLPLVVDTFLWVDRTNSMMVSITDGARRYQGAAVADLLEASRGRYSGAAEKLKEYMRELAVSVDAKMQIAHEEAQRCRTELVIRPR